MFLLEIGLINYLNAGAPKGYALRLRATEIDLHFSVSSVLRFPGGNGEKEPGKKEP